MNSSPIVARELRVRARLPGTHRLRWLVAGGALIISLSLVLDTAGKPATAGQTTFYSLAGLAMVFCLFEGPRCTADCLSREKREGTLGLLFLTDLGGVDVVLGKLFAVSLNSVYGVFAILPVMALPILFRVIPLYMVVSLLVSSMSLTSTYFYLAYWPILISIKNILLVRWARGRLMNHFRDAAAHETWSKNESSSWAWLAKRWPAGACPSGMRQEGT